jgi:hypothetical protein
VTSIAHPHISGIVLAGGLYGPWYSERSLQHSITSDPVWLWSFTALFAVRSSSHIRRVQETDSPLSSLSCQIYGLTTLYEICDPPGHVPAEYQEGIYSTWYLAPITFSRPSLGLRLRF